LATAVAAPILLGSRRDRRALPPYERRPGGPRSRAGAPRSV